jgi:hypothetical protein
MVQLPQALAQRQLRVFLAAHPDEDDLLFMPIEHIQNKINILNTVKYCFSRATI